MTDRKVVDLKPFVPRRTSKSPSASMPTSDSVRTGATIRSRSLKSAGYRFLLQNFYVAELAGNFMMSLAVANADEWWAHIEARELKATYGLHMAKPPAIQPWGLRVLYLSDASGVLCTSSIRPPNLRE